MSETSMSGGCQCGAVRFRMDGEPGGPGVCHCRMCQKATGGFFGAYTTAPSLTWTRGAPKYFQSSNIGRRGFCADCGTPLTFESVDGIEVAIGAFDNPAAIVPVIAIGLEGKLPYADALADLPIHSEETLAQSAAFRASIVSYQHPDHDKDRWPVKR